MIPDLIIASGVLMLALLMSKQARVIIRLQQAVTQETSLRAQLEVDIQALLTCSRSIAERFHETTARQHSLTTQVQTITQNTGHTGDKHLGISDAYRLLSEGLPVDKVAELCALSQGEAALLARWQQRRAAA